MYRFLINETAKHIGEKVKVAGWVNSRRAHGKILFIDLRDRSGILQTVFTPSNKETYELAGQLRPEWVVEIIGQIVKRPEQMVNPKMETGQVELSVESLNVLSKAETLPLSIEGDGYDIGEEVRMKYRYLDLRRERMKNNLIARHKVIKFIRDFLDKEGFIEIETPILTKPTPEGARDYLVPSRLNHGKFYALPQSPQQYKQLLQVAGFEKYFQIARCFRDEDPRGDRQPEFTQLDLEMSFVDQEDILDLIERLYTAIVKIIAPEKKIQQVPFPRIPYSEVIKKYNSDKPDLRKNKNDPNELAFAFVVDFPLFVQQTKEDFFYGAGEKLAPSHHMFTAPKKEDVSLLDSDPLKAKSYQHDFILNGYEIGGGSIRIHDPKIQNKIFNLIGFTSEQKNQFSHMLEAFKYGAPPHGGIAPGIDRFLMILNNEPSIREVIAFPKTGDATDLMMQAPSEVDIKQLKELQIKTVSITNTKAKKLDKAKKPAKRPAKK
ncbi:MAG: aspartate--tRNA ligase [Patescibacteria group bacterium]|mgnify:CR=1 FL=1